MLQFLVALAPPARTRDVEALRAALAPLGGRVLNYIPDHTLLVAAPRRAVGAMRRLPGAGRWGRSLHMFSRGAMQL